MSLEPLLQSLRQYYTAQRDSVLSADDAYMQRQKTWWDHMDALTMAHPEMPACLLKAHLQEMIAEEFTPVIFTDCPFFFEMGVRPAENWGNPGGRTAASWRYYRTNANRSPDGPWENIWRFHGDNPANPWQIWMIWNFFDVDHHSLSYTRLLSEGVEGLLTRIADRQQEGASPEQLAFLEAAQRGCRAVLRVAERFALAAEVCLEQETDPEARRYLTMLVSSARQVPAHPPRTFYEGLAAILFLREATASLENIGISVMGHIDRLLGPLLDADLAAGRLDETEAKDLLARWMVYTDIKFFVEEKEWPETSTTVELGGCDENGRPVFNKVTQWLIEVHRELHLVNPKLNCRYSQSSSNEYLDLLSTHAVAGHNVFAFLNDDVMIPALVRSGKSEREARLYVNGGCQEPICEGVEHSAGAYFYFNLARVLDLCLLGQDGWQAGDDAVVPTQIQDTTDFEEIYQAYLLALSRAWSQGAIWLREGGRTWSNCHPCPWFSASLAGCIENARDYSAGGARHNPANLALVGFATVVDSLVAIQYLLEYEGPGALAILRQALAANWVNFEDLHRRLVALPKWGEAHEITSALAARLSRDLVTLARPLVNERGGPFVASLFTYYFHVSWCGCVRATPDGRHAGDIIGGGASPGRVRPLNTITDIILSQAAVDWRDFPGNAVLDLQLPVMGDERYLAKQLPVLLKTFAALSGMTLQTNCVSGKRLLQAQINPDQFRDMTVRICGLSARFVALKSDVQDEIIGRFAIA